MFPTPIYPPSNNLSLEEMMELLQKDQERNKRSLAAQSARAANIKRSNVATHRRFVRGKK